MRTRRRRLQRLRRKERKNQMLYRALQHEWPTVALPILRSVVRKKTFYRLGVF